MAEQNPYEFLDPAKGYQSPLQQDLKSDYAKAMLYGKNQQPVHHWAQGVSNMVNALMGGRMLNDVGQKDTNFQRGLMQNRENQVIPPNGGSPPGPTQPEGQASPEPQPQQSLMPQALVPGSVSSPGSDNSTGSPWPGDKKVNSLHPEFQPRINQLIDILKNKYGLEADIGEGYRPPERQAQLYAQGRTTPGPVVTHAGPNSSYHQFGSAGDLRPKNMPEPQAAFVLKRALNENPQLGLKGIGDWDPFHVQLNQPLGALRAQGPFRPSVTQNAMPSEAQSVARALNPATGSNEPPATSEPAPAEAGVPKVAPGGQSPIPGTPGQQILPPGQIPPHPPEFNRGAFGAATLPTKYGNLGAKVDDVLATNTLNRGQSQKIPYGPGFIIVGRDGSQRYDAPYQEEKVKGVEGQERTRTFQMVPSGKTDASGNPTFVKRYTGTESEGESGPAPAQPNVELPDIGVPKPAQAEVPQARTTPPGPGGMLGQPPPAEALGDVMPRAGLDNPAPPATPQAPASPPQAPVPPAPPPAPAAPRPAMAQAAKTSEQLQQEMKQEGVDYDYLKALNQTEAKEYPKTQETLLQKGTQAVDAINQLKLMRTASEHKDFQSGAFAPARVEFLRAAGFLMPGVVDPNKTEPNDVFDKLRAGAVLQSLQNNLANQGLGRILQTEVQLLNTTVGSSNNSPAAIRAILDLNQRAAQKMVAAANIAKGYEQGGRIDPKTGTWAVDRNDKPIITTKRGSNTDLLTNINNWATHKDNQLYAPEQQKDFIDMFKDRKPEEGKEGAKPQRVNPIRQLFSPTPSATPEEALKRKIGQ